MNTTMSNQEYKQVIQQCSAKCEKVGGVATIPPKTEHMVLVTDLFNESDKVSVSARNLLSVFIEYDDKQYNVQKNVLVPKDAVPFRTGSTQEIAGIPAVHGG